MLPDDYDPTYEGKMAKDKPVTKAKPVPTKPAAKVVKPMTVKKPKGKC